MQKQGKKKCPSHGQTPASLPLHTSPPPPKCFDRYKKRAPGQRPGFPRFGVRASSRMGIFINPINYIAPAPRRSKPIFSSSRSSAFPFNRQYGNRSTPTNSIAYPSLRVIFTSRRSPSSATST